jgi:hypothetical protein
MIFFFPDPYSFPCFSLSLFPSPYLEFFLY